ncbi:MAG: hypothetical protein ACKOA2_02685 [Ilumatobacteraceae bacterium]
MHLARQLALSGEARAALGQIVAIMTDQVLAGEGRPRWDVEQLMALEVRLGTAADIDDLVTLADSGDEVVTLGIDDAALLLDGMAFTEIASADLPWVEMVRWTADFVTTELRRPWTDDEWLAYATDRR